MTRSSTSYLYPGPVLPIRRPSRVRDPSLERLLGAAVLGAAVLGAAAVGGCVAFVRRTASGHLYSESEVPPAPVGLVLGAQVNPDGTPSAFLAARLDLARRLYESGKIAVVLVSGDHRAREYDEPDAMRRYLIATGVPAARIVTDHAGFDTYDSAYRARTIFGVSDVVIITQSYHLPRAVATARRLGLSARGVGDDSVGHARAWRKGVVRDQVACVKTVLDLITRRTPVLGPAEPGVRDALRG